MYDDEDEYQDESEPEQSQADLAFSQKGVADRAFVDQQAKEYDEMKKRKRDAIDALKHERLAAQSKLDNKQRELSALELRLRKDDYLETRERVASERNDQPEGEFAREQQADIDIGEMRKESEHAARNSEYEVKLSEVRALKAIVDESARKISILEHDLLRS
jgi:hypothetical protein